MKAGQELSWHKYTTSVKVKGESMSAWCVGTLIGVVVRKTQSSLWHIPFLLLKAMSKS